MRGRSGAEEEGGPRDEARLVLCWGDCGNWGLISTEASRRRGCHRHCPGQLPQPPWSLESPAAEVKPPCRIVTRRWSFHARRAVFLQWASAPGGPGTERKGRGPVVLENSAPAEGRCGPGHGRVRPTGHVPVAGRGGPPAGQGHAHPPLLPFLREEETAAPGRPWLDAEAPPRHRAPSCAS